MPKILIKHIINFLLMKSSLFLFCLRMCFYNQLLFQKGNRFQNYVKLDLQLLPYSDIYHKFIKSGEQITSQQNRSEKCESFQDQNIKTSKWTSNQKICFVMFWMHKFLHAPLEICSFDAPLSRKSYFQELSDYIRNQLGVEFSKTAQQSKSRFSAIKRKVKRQRKNLTKSDKYDFYDYILDEAKSLCKVEAGLQGEGQLMKMVRKLEAFLQQEGEFMKVQIKMNRFQLSGQVNQKNNETYRYLHEIQSSLPDTS